MIKAVIFDLDNTLTDFMKMKRAAVDAAVDAMIDAGLSMSRDALQKKIYAVYESEGIEDQQVFDKVLLKELGYVDPKILAAGIIRYRRAREANLFVYPRVHLTLMELVKRGIRLCVLSDAPRLPVWLRIVSLNLQNYFDFVISFDDTGERKPSPKPFRLALERLGTSPAETLMVGDWAERDIAGAKKLGIRTVFARYGDCFNTGESGADFEINDITELLAVVDGIAPMPEMPLFEEKKSAKTPPGARQ